MASQRVILLILVRLFSSLIGPTVGQSLVHTAVLDPDGKFHVSWDFTDTEITFEVTAKTRGYFGLGFSSNGGMAGSDIVIGWVDDNTGQGHLSDRHAVGNLQPLVDDKMDYTHLSSVQNDTHTAFRFSRPLNLCGDEDRSITEATIRLIWAYSDNDPGADEEPSYHGTNRGSKSIFLLNPQKKVPELPDDVIQYEILNPAIPIPEVHTTYWCQTFAIPKLSTKHHIIQIDPVITPGLEAEIHHIVLFGCFHEINSSLSGVGHPCYHPNMPQDFKGCSAVQFAWAVGGGPLYFPKETGLPLGYDMDPTMLLLQTHYDNPQRKPGLIDSSGFRLIMTPTLRLYDAGLLETGVKVGRNQVIPPYSESFKSNGHCYPECLSQGMANNQEWLKIFGYALHSHLAGHAINLRHFRNGVEQPLIAKDTNYDFNLQEGKVLKEEVTITANDHFIVECYYKTDDRTTVTFGGLSTREEMCTGYILYYPRIPLTRCKSSITYPRLGHIVGVTAETNGSVTAPPEYAGKTISEVINNDIDWTNKMTRKQFEMKYNEEGVDGYIPYCTFGKKHYPIMSVPKPLPEVQEIPQGEQLQCCCATFISSTFLMIAAFTVWTASTMFDV